MVLISKTKHDKEIKHQIVLKGSLRLEHPSVQSVIEIAEEIINENKVLNSDILYNVAKKRLQIPRNGLLSIIYFLINKKIIVEGSKYIKEDLLSNQYRKNIYNFIKNNLGSHFSLIRKAIFSENVKDPGSTGQLIWHLGMLLKFNYVKQIKFKNYTVFLPIEIDDEMGILYFLFKDKINKKIVNLLIKQNSIKMAAIHEIIDEKRHKVYYRTKLLIDCDIFCVKEEKNYDISLNPEKKEIIIQVINNISTLDK